MANILEKKKERVQQAIDYVWDLYVDALTKREKSAMESLAHVMQILQDVQKNLRKADAPEVTEEPWLYPGSYARIFNFTVIDPQTGEYPDLEELALKEPWADGLMYCDMEGFALGEDGTLMLMDECGKFAYPPENRFHVVYDWDVPAQS